MTGKRVGKVALWIAIVLLILYFSGQGPSWDELLEENINPITGEDLTWDNYCKWKDCG